MSRSEMSSITGGDVAENAGCGVSPRLVLTGGIVGGCGSGATLGSEICRCWTFDGNWSGTGEGFSVGLKTESEYPPDQVDQPPGKILEPTLRILHRGAQDRRSLERAEIIFYGMGIYRQCSLSVAVEGCSCLGQIVDE